MIYQSPVIPRSTVGYAYNLRPQLAEKVKQAVLAFGNESAAADEGGGKPMHFIPADYKKDFDFVRRIDASFDPRLGGKPPKAKAAGNPPADAGPAAAAPPAGGSN